jgi:two-component system, NarL family, nitrate/nitrite response regulator NarL
MNSPQHTDSDEAMDPLREAAAESLLPQTVIVSDVRLFREGLAIGLSASRDVCVVGTAATFEEVRTLLASIEPAVVLLDVGMPGALSFARRLRQMETAVRIVAVAVADEGTEVLACAEAGISGYVPHDGSITDAATAIRDAMIDEVHCSPRVSATLFKRLSSLAVGGASQGSTLLTPREAEVVELIDRGLSNKQIGQQLRIGTATVKNHVHNLLEKLQVRRRAEAAACTRAQRYADPPILSRRSRSRTLSSS